MSPLGVNNARLHRRLRELGSIGATEGGGCCRLALSAEDKEGRDRVVQWMRDLGLTIRIDPLGNVTGIRPGKHDVAPVMCGSHIDTVRTGGIYDGNLGVLAGLEIVERLNEEGIETERPFAVSFFTNEEGARFAPDMMGSLFFVGALSLVEAHASVGIDGATVGEALQAIGYGGAAGAMEVHAFVELHIEQGPMLEKEGVTIGAVDSVQGISWTEYTVTGVSNHAGTTPMRLRHDAGWAAAAITCFVRELAWEMGGNQVATVGRVLLGPNLVNVVPNYAQLTVDLRNTDGAALREAERRTAAFVRKLAQKEGVQIAQRSLARFDPVSFDSEMVERIYRAAQERGYSVCRMPSGAGHDAQMLQRICPSAIVFVPSRDGISHNVSEYTAKEHIEAGANVLLDVLLALLQAPIS